MTGPYRVAPLLDDPFELPGDLPGRTDTGSVWVRWANVGNYSGWYAVGTRVPERTETFWDKVYVICTRVGNGHIDAVHAIGPGVLSLGGLGVTAASGAAQELLAMCMEASPHRFMECMAVPLYRSGLYLRQKDGQWAFCRPEDGSYVTTDVSLNSYIRGGSDSTWWGGGAKDEAKRWVDACSRLLRDQSFDVIQRMYLEHSAVKLLSPSLRNLIRWSTYGARDAWQWTLEQQSVWAVAMVLAISDPDSTEELIRASHHGDALATLRDMRMNATSGRFAETFQRRIMSALGGVEELFRIQLGTGVG